MTLLVTGGTGFVMSVVARAWLDRDPLARAVILDRSGLDAAAERHFALVRDRLADAVDTFDTPVSVARELGIRAHDGDLHHVLFLHHMASNGIEVVSTLQ